MNKDSSKPAMSSVLIAGAVGSALLLIIALILIVNAYYLFGLIILGASLAGATYVYTHQYPQQSVGAEEKGKRWDDMMSGE